MVCLTLALPDPPTHKESQSARQDDIQTPELSKDCRNFFVLCPIVKTLTPLESSQLCGSDDMHHYFTSQERERERERERFLPLSGKDCVKSVCPTKSGHAETGLKKLSQLSQSGRKIQETSTILKIEGSRDDNMRTTLLK